MKKNTNDKMKRIIYERQKSLERENPKKIKKKEIENEVDYNVYYSNKKINHMI